MGAAAAAGHILPSLGAWINMKRSAIRTLVKWSGGRGSRKNEMIILRLNKRIPAGASGLLVFYAAPIAVDARDVTLSFAEACVLSHACADCFLRFRGGARGSCACA